MHPHRIASTQTLYPVKHNMQLGYSPLLHVFGGRVVAVNEKVYSGRQGDWKSGDKSRRIIGL